MNRHNAKKHGDEVDVKKIEVMGKLGYKIETVSVIEE